VDVTGAVVVGADVVVVVAGVAITNVTSLVEAACVAVAAAVARTTHVPAPVNVKRPEEEFTEQPVVPELKIAYEIEPGPLDEAATDGATGDDVVNNVVVGFHDTVWAASCIWNATSDVAEENRLVAAAVARTVHVPTAVKVTTEVDELTEHPVVPALTTE
jgi:hypothetical protein